MRYHFSADGRYLDVVSFTCDMNDVLKPMIKALFQTHNPTRVKITVYTYRLYTQKPTRGHPLPIHFQFVDGRTSFFETARLYPRLPLTLHWTSTHLYMTHSCPALLVLKIPLFRWQEHTVQDTSRISKCQLCKETIPLPASASGREVFFFPSERDTSAHIIVGGQIVRNGCARFPPDLQAPVGCVLDIAADMGGWTETIRDRYVECPPVLLSILRPKLVESEPGIIDKYVRKYYSFNS